MHDEIRQAYVMNIHRYGASLLSIYIFTLRGLWGMIFNSLSKMNTLYNGLISISKIKISIYVYAYIVFFFFFGEDNKLEFFENRWR